VRRGVAVCLREQLEGKEFCVGRGDQPAESLWAGVSGQTNITSVVVGDCYRCPDQEEVVNK